jgi:hypothetical protein
MLRQLLAVVAVCACIQADSQFDLKWKTYFQVTADATPKLCFQNTKTVIPFNYEEAAVTGTSANNYVTKAAVDELNCGVADGRIENLFSDRVWAVPRGSAVSAGECLDLLDGEAYDTSFDGATFLTANVLRLRSNATNLPYRLVVTRNLWACKYDSVLDNGYTGGVFDAADVGAALPKVALRREKWTVYALEDSGTSLEELYTTAAGSTEAAAFNSPESSDSSSFYEPFAGGSATCVRGSRSTCKPRATTQCSTSEQIESYGCASSAQLFARSGGYRAPSESFNEFPGLGVDFFGPDVTGSSGLVAELFARVDVTIESWFGFAMESRTMVPGRSLSQNNQKSQTIVLGNLPNYSEFETQLGFVTQSNDMAFKFRVSTSPSGAATSVAAPLVSFNAESGTISYFNSWTQLDGASIGGHYWSSLISDFELNVNWTCRSIGSTKDAPVPADILAINATTYGRFRFNCDSTYSQATTTPGRTYNDLVPDQPYPAVPRQYIGYAANAPFTAVRDVISVSNFNGDRFYIAQYTDGTNTPYKVADNAEGINNELSRSNNDDAYAAFYGSNKRGDGWRLWGAGTVVLAVFVSIAVCIAASVLAKSSNAGKSLDVNFSGAKKQA